MRSKTAIWLFSSLFGAAALCGAAFGPCKEHLPLENGLAGFRVIVRGVEGAGEGSGTPDDPYPFAAGEVVLTFDAQALDQFAQPLESFANEVGLRVSPGELVDPAQRVQFHQGRVQGATARVRKLSGQVALWLEEVSWAPAEPAWGLLRPVAQRRDEGSWATGVSNLIHFQNPTLRHLQWDPSLELNDQSVLGRRYLEIDCRIDHPDAVFEDGHGQLVVTGVVNEGFFVTDLVDRSLGFNHLYAFNFSRPEDLEAGDRLDLLAGSGAEFSGATQISFPTWRRAVDTNEDPLPFRVRNLDQLLPPALITRAMCDENATSNAHLCGYSKKSWELESLESARVRLEDFRAPDVFVTCDFDGDLQIPWVPEERDEVGRLEVTCRDACLKRDGSTIILAREVRAKPEVLRDLAVNTCTGDEDCSFGQCGGYTAPDRDDGVCRTICPWERHIQGIRPNCLEIRVTAARVCSELSTMEQFGQWSVALEGGSGPLINVITRESLPEFDPTALDNLGAVHPYLQGNLRQVRASRPRWIVIAGDLKADVPDSMRPGAVP